MYTSACVYLYITCMKWGKFCTLLSQFRVILRGLSDSLPKQNCCKNICNLLCAVCCSKIFIKHVVTYVENGRWTFPVIAPDHFVALRKGLRVDVTLVSPCRVCFFLSFFLSFFKRGTWFRRPSSLCYSISLCSQNRSGEVITGDTKTEYDPGLNFNNSKIQVKFLLPT
jgi:hypothetical protein